MPFANERIARWGARFGTGDCQGLLPKDSSLPRGSWVPLARGCLPKKGRSGLARVNTRRWLKEVRRRALSTFQFAGYGLPSLQCPLPLIPRPNPADIVVPLQPNPLSIPWRDPCPKLFFCRDPCSWRHQRRPDSRGDRSMGPVRVSKGRRGGAGGKCYRKGIKIVTTRHRRSGARTTPGPRPLRPAPAYLGRPGGGGNQGLGGREAKGVSGDSRRGDGEGS